MGRLGRTLRRADERGEYSGGPPSTVGGPSWRLPAEIPFYTPASLGGAVAGVTRAPHAGPSSPAWSLVSVVPGGYNHTPLTPQQKHCPERAGAAGRGEGGVERGPVELFSVTSQLRGGSNSRLH